MIPNQWYAVLESSEVVEGKATGARRMGENLVFWRDTDGTILAALDRCPHRGAALNKGRIIDGHIECPFHGFLFEPSGRCVQIPANGKDAPVPKIFLIKTFEVTEAHGFIWLWWGEKQDSYPPLPWFDDIDDSFTYGTYRQHWNTHYSRGIENQLDVLHLPFIHKKSIGRGNKTLVNGPATFLDEETNSLRVWVYNEVDRGQTPLKPGEYTEPPEEPYRLRFNFPNIWQNQIMDDMRVVVAFAPIDDENTLFYLRYYQRFLKVPLLTPLMNRLGGIMNSVVAGEDRWIVVTQRPFRSDLRMDEKMVPGDGPVIVYRRRRQELIEAAAQNGAADVPVSAEMNAAEFVEYSSTRPIGMAPPIE